ncbi:MAG: hypothetical protein KGZ66_01880 [Selenomonadales bacterium]|jgi:hypothetical protein|nr:hypothetical protein [Selenomonadales bacterium]
MAAKVALKAAVWAAMNPEDAGKVILVVVGLVFFPLFILAAPFLLMVSTPLAPPQAIQLYMQATDEAMSSLAGEWHGPPEIDWRAVLAVDAVRRRQDFSSFEFPDLKGLPPEHPAVRLRNAKLQEIRELALRFVEIEDFIEVEKFVGYETIYDEEGNAVGERAVYTVVRIPVYRVLPVAEVAGLLGMTAEEGQWAEVMYQTIKKGGHF